MVGFKVYYGEIPAVTNIKSISGTSLAGFTGLTHFNTLQSHP